MSNTAALGAIEYEIETTWGEDVTTFTTHRLPVLDAIDVSGLVHNKIAPNRVVQYRNDGTPWITMDQGGEFKVKLHLTGHGSTTSGATTVMAIETFLGYVFGNVTVSSATGTTVTGGTATAPTLAGGAFAASSLCRIGAIGDGRGNGQFYAVNAHGANLVLLTAMDATPNNGDVVYSAVNIYPSETPTSGSVQSMRMRFLSANLKYEAHGVFPKSLSISGLNAGEVPTIEVTLGVSWWRQTATGTFPSTVTQSAFTPAPVAAGSFFLQTVGTTTRSKRTHRDLSIEYTMGIAELKGPGGLNQYQSTIGARRLPDSIRVSWSEDAATTIDDLWTSTNRLHACITLSAVAGSAVGFYMPNLCITGARPLQFNGDGINRQRIEAMAYTGPELAAGELGLSAFRMGFA
ncbi:MAG: hypothetical protein E6Q97_38480 [Desulfurellales bacterium]|nr:MAG: hypothetical protein E6Q97_38480 [Desulfurellales bacterium]